MPAKTLLNLYNALTKPHLLYGLGLWESTYPCTTQEPLQRLQNNAVRSITGISSFEHTTHYFTQLDILKIHDLVKLRYAHCANLKTLNFLTHFRITLLFQVMYGTSLLH